MNLKQQKELLNHIDDILAELNGQKSNRPIGQGITRDQYVEGELIQLYNLIETLASAEEELNYLQNERNKLNRQISSLKKASLKTDMDLCDECGEMVIKPSNLTLGAKILCKCGAEYTQ